jgi:hypothetical protein
MIVYRVVTSSDILAGKTGEAIPSLRMASNRAQELANETGKEVTLTSFNTMTKAFEFIRAFYPSAAHVRATRDKADAERKRKDMEARLKKMREENEDALRRIRLEQEAFMRRFRQEQERTRAQFYSEATANSPRKTKLSVAMSNLDLKEGFDQPTLKSHYRKMVMKHHPDRGGTVTNFQYIQKSYEYILEVKGWKG